MTYPGDLGEARLRCGCAHPLQCVGAQKVAALTAEDEERVAGQRMEQRPHVDGRPGQLERRADRRVVIENDRTMLLPTSAMRGPQPIGVGKAVRNAAIDGGERSCSVVPALESLAVADVAANPVETGCFQLGPDV